MHLYVCHFDMCRKLQQLSSLDSMLGDNLFDTKILQQTYSRMSWNQWNDQQLSSCFRCQRCFKRITRWQWNHVIRTVDCGLSLSHRKSLRSSFLSEHSSSSIYFNLRVQLLQVSLNVRNMFMYSRISRQSLTWECEEDKRH